MPLKDLVSGLGLLRALVKGIARHNTLLEELVDELRMINGRLPRYIRDETGVIIDPAVLLDTDYTKIEFLRGYAQSVGVFIDDFTDIEALARKRGWMDRDGNVTVEGWS